MLLPTKLVTVVLSSVADNGRRPELDPGGLAGRDGRLLANEPPEPLGQRVDDALAGNAGRHHDERAIAPALRGRQPAHGTLRAVERLGEHLVEFLVQVQADFVVTSRAWVNLVMSSS